MKCCENTDKLPHNLFIFTVVMCFEGLYLMFSILAPTFLSCFEEFYRANMSKRDRVVTVFSKEGQLLQVEYAKRAAQGGSLTVGIRGADVAVLAAEKRVIESLQTERTVRKISVLDDNICLAFAGVTADGRIVMNRAQIECKSYKLTLEDEAPIEYIARFIANLKQRYTQKHGVRPFGIACLLVGFDDYGRPRLYHIEPSGEYSEWRASAIGQNSRIIMNFLEKYYNQLELLNERSTIKMVIRALLEVLPQDSDDMEVKVMKRGQPLMTVSKEDIEEYMQEIDVDRKDEEEELQQEQMQLL